MKKITILLSLVFAIITINAQTTNSGNPDYKSFLQFNDDSLSYLRVNFESNKSFYVGKQVSVLINDLELIPLSDNFSLNNYSGCDAITLFYIPDEQLGWALVKKQKLFAITLVFNFSISKDEFQSFLMEYRGSGILGKWTNVEKTFYGTRIIKDIVVNVINDK